MVYVIFMVHVFCESENNKFVFCIAFILIVEVSFHHTFWLEFQHGLADSTSNFYIKFVVSHCSIQDHSSQKQ